MQVLLSGYLLLSSFLVASSQGRDRDIYDLYAQDYQHSLETRTIDDKYKNPPVEVGFAPLDLARKAAKGSGEAENYAGHSFFIGFFLLLFSATEFLLILPMRQRFKGLKEETPPKLQ
jgi:hypothetical protein